MNQIKKQYPSFLLTVSVFFIPSVAIIGFDAWLNNSPVECNGMIGTNFTYICKEITRDRLIHQKCDCQTISTDEFKPEITE